MESKIVEFQKPDYTGDLDGVYWVTGAISKEILRSINCVKVEDNQIIGTDGHRMHIYKLNQLVDDGCYRVIKRTKGHVVLKQDDVDFPNWKFVFPKDDPKDTFTVRNSKDGGIWPSLATVIRALQGSAINGDYFKDAIGNDTFECMVYDIDQPIVIRNESKQAIIMPIRR